MAQQPGVTPLTAPAASKNDAPQVGAYLACPVLRFDSTMVVPGGGGGHVYKNTFNTASAIIAMAASIAGLKVIELATDLTLPAGVVDLGDAYEIRSARPDGQEARVHANAGTTMRPDVTGATWDGVRIQGAGGGIGPLYDVTDPALGCTVTFRGGRFEHPQILRVAADCTVRATIDNVLSGGGTFEALDDSADFLVTVIGGGFSPGNVVSSGAQPVLRFDGAGVWIDDAIAPWMTVAIGAVLTSNTGSPVDPNSVDAGGPLGAEGEGAQFVDGRSSVTWMSTGDGTWVRVAGPVYSLVYRQGAPSQAGNVFGSIATLAVSARTLNGQVLVGLDAIEGQTPAWNDPVDLDFGPNVVIYPATERGRSLLTVDGVHIINATFLAIDEVDIQIANAVDSTIIEAPADGLTLDVTLRGRAKVRFADGTPPLGRFLDAPTGSRCVLRLADNATLFAGDDGEGGKVPLVRVASDIASTRIVVEDLAIVEDGAMDLPARPPLPALPPPVLGQAAPGSVPGAEIMPYLEVPPGTMLRGGFGDPNGHLFATAAGAYYLASTNGVVWVSTNAGTWETFAIQCLQVADNPATLGIVPTVAGTLANDPVTTRAFYQYGDDGVWRASPFL